MRVQEDRRPTLASWPKQIYQWSELPGNFYPALEAWRQQGMPPGNVTYIPQLRQGGDEEEYALAWWHGQVLLQTEGQSGVRTLLIQGGASALSYEVQLLKCTVTLYLKGGERACFSYNKVKEEQLRPVLALLLGRSSDLVFPAVHPEPEGVEELLEESYGMYHTALLCYRLGGCLKDWLFFKGRAGRLLYLLQRTPDPEYFLGWMDRGLAAISRDSYSTRVLYAPRENLDALKLAPAKRGQKLEIAAAGGIMSIPLLPGQEPRVAAFLKRLSGCP